MKTLVIAFFAFLLLFGCGSPELDSPKTLDDIIDAAVSFDLGDPQTLDDIIADAIDEDRLQYRGKVGEELCYVPNGQTPYTGWVKNLYENGQVKDLGHLKDGKWDGLSAWWYENGQKKEEENYKDNNRDGLATSWYENGQVRMITHFKDNYVVRLKQWHRNGTPRWDIGYMEGKVFDNDPLQDALDSNSSHHDGIMTVWYKNGKKYYEANYKDGKIDGLDIGWYENGQKMYEGNFRGDNLNVPYTSWYENGQKLSEDYYKDDKLVTVISQWKPNGEKCSITSLVEGNGVVVYYTDDCSEDYRVTYKNGEIVED